MRATQSGVCAPPHPDDRPSSDWTLADHLRL